MMEDVAEFWEWDFPGQGMEEAAGQVSHEVWLPWKMALGVV